MTTIKRRLALTLAAPTLATGSLAVGASAGHASGEVGAGTGPDKTTCPAVGWCKTPDAGWNHVRTYDTRTECRERDNRQYAFNAASQWKCDGTTLFSVPNTGGVPV